MQLRRIWDGTTPLVQLNAGHGWIDVREILTRLSPRFSEDKLANWSSNPVALHHDDLRRDNAGRHQAGPDTFILQGKLLPDQRQHGGVSHVE